MTTDPDAILSAFCYFRMLDLCDGTSWAYSVAYREEGRVGELTVTDGALMGTVDGLVPHTARLWAERGEPRWSCTCPVAEGGLLCGHGIAVAETYERQVAEQGLVPPEPDEEEEYLREEERHREYLRTLDSETLVEMVMEQTMVCAHGWLLSERLAARVATAAGATIDISAWRDHLDRAFGTGDYVDADRMAGWTREVHEVVEALDGLTDLGQAESVSQLYEYASGLLARAVTRTDDSLGWLEGPRRLIGAFHHRACEVARPDPVELAGRLAELELRFPSGVFYQAAVRYADLLGVKGLAEYQRLLDLRHDAMRSNGAVPQGERRALTKAMVGVALASRDPDQLVEAKRYDMGTPEDYREVASMLADVGRVDDAVDWVRRGLTLFGGLPWKNPSAGLWELLATLHRRQGDAAGTAEALWKRFVADPLLSAYQQMMREPEIAVDVDAWRGRVLEHLRRPLPPALIAGPSVLPEILAYEGSFDEAWEAAKDGCARELRLTLARAREQAHPEDAISVYEEAADMWIATQKVSGYLQAVRLIARIEWAYERLGRTKDFTTYVVGLYVKHCDKPRFIMLLSGAGGGAY